MMKKLFVLFFTVLLCCSASFGQAKDSVALNVQGTETKLTNEDVSLLVEYAQAKMVQEAQVANDSSIVVVPPPGGTPTLDWLFNEKNGVFAALMLLLMYASGHLPFLQKIDDKRKRAIVVGVFLAIGTTVWLIFDKGVTWQAYGGMALTFVSTQLTYIFGLAPIGLKTPEKKQ